MAAAAMYKMKPIYNNTAIEDALPTNMYKMKNFHENVADDVVMECAELQELKHRQETVLKDLEKLKAEISQISSDIGVEGGSYVKPKASSCTPVSNKEPLNIVVSASPNDPPLSLFLLQKIVHHHGLACSVVSHVHSSLTVPLPQCLHNTFGTSDTSDTSNICLRLIWKNQILAPSLMVSVAYQSPVLGEVNILRYLCRLFLPDFYCGHEPLHMTNIDAWLNAAIKLTTSESAKEGKTFVQTLNSHLGKHKWLVGSGPSLADIYCSIVILKTNGGNTLPKNIQKWFGTCRKEFPGFQDVEKLCK